MSKDLRRSINLRLTDAEFAAITFDAEQWGVRPTTLVLCDALAAAQERRMYGRDLTVPASRACKAMSRAAEALRAGDAQAALDILDTAGPELVSDVQARTASNLQVIGPGWRARAYRHQIDWQSTGLPILDDPTDG